tara:strand:- start:1618 stop:2088 length:471 start_codon:yes stop_codon:yes gene_type:complete
MVCLATLVGYLIGVGAYTFHYAKGTSYLSSDPASCANCHIMRPQYDSWQKSSHHAFATCNDCHLPPSGLAKWISKADNGFVHSKAFTLQDFHEPIRLRQVNVRVLQDNCLRCHAELVENSVADTSSFHAGSCVHCHRDVGHGPRAGLGGPMDWSNE